MRVRLSRVSTEKIFEGALARKKLNRKRLRKEILEKINSLCENCQNRVILVNAFGDGAAACMVIPLGERLKVVISWRKLVASRFKGIRG